MPQCCAVPMCSKKTGGHKFPKDKIRLKQWLVALRRDRFTPTQHSRVCKDHFSKNDYELPKESVLDKPRLLLKKNAVPSRFPWNQATCDSLHNEKKEQELLGLVNDTTKKENIENINQNESPDACDIIVLSFDCGEVKIISQSKYNSIIPKANEHQDSNFVNDLARKT